MADEPAAADPAPLGNGGRQGRGNGAEFATLRRLLVGPEQHRLDELTRELRERYVSAAELAEHLPEAINLRGQRDKQIGRALAPTVETALRESIRRNPREIATAIFPILGPAIRKSIAETMAALVRSINSAVEHSLTPRGIKWRLESWRTGVPYAQVVIKHALIYRVEQAFLIHAETGLLLAHATAPGLKVPDADLISGMLTAIQDFVRDAFRPGESAMLRTFSVGEHTVQVEAGPAALLALVVRGQAPEALLRKQQDTLETIHLQFATALAEFTGDASLFQATQPLLEVCLETVVDTGKQRATRFQWMRWAIPALVVGLALLALGVRSRMRFQSALALLSNEPGLVVLEAQRRWRDWRISGLRDPSARPAEVVLAGAGLTPRALRGHWEPYLSLDSAVVAARARRTWALPEVTGLALRADTLTVTGDLPLASVHLLQLLPAGVSRVVLGEVRVLLPAHLDSIRESLMQDRVLFESGSAELRASEAARIRLAALRFRALEDSVAASDGEVTLTLSGRTDPTGSEEINQYLAQWRVDRVTAIFAEAGVQARRLRGEALATARPIDAPDPLERARINRSVSYGIDVSARPRVIRER